MKARYGFILLILLIGSPSKLPADTPALPFDYKQATANDEYVFVMLAPAEEGNIQDPTIRNRYPVSGLYRNNGFSIPEWTVDWYAFQVFVSSDGRHLVRMGPWPTHPEEFALAFYDRGKDIQSYKISELVKDFSKLPHSVSHFQWSKQIDFNDQAGTLTIVTFDDQEYLFDVRSGTILS
jgi:hypothetical protein